MIWNFTDSSNLTMKRLNLDEINSYLEKIKDKELYAYGVYQIEADGRSLFSKIEGEEDTIMGLPVKQIKEYLSKMKQEKQIKEKFKVKKYLVIGNPIDYSLPPKLQNYWIKNNNIKEIYEKKKLND